jgi:TRAP-type C4-dicarboxylate transport system permease small subunit
VDGIERTGHRRIDAVLGIASAALLLILMMITVADVLLRYLFSAPIRGAFELTELMLLVLIFAGLPLVSRADEHVTMDFVDRVLTSRGRAIVIRAVHILTAAAMLVLAWLIWLKAGKIAAYADTTESLKIPVAPFVYFMALTIAATGVIHLWKALISAPPPPRDAEALRAREP